MIMVIGGLLMAADRHFSHIFSAEVDQQPVRISDEALYGG